MKKGDTQAAAALAERLTESISVEMVAVSTNHPVVDAVLNQKFHAARERGMSMTFRVGDMGGLRLNVIITDRMNTLPFHKVHRQIRPHFKPRLPELEEKMKNNTELAQKVMERVDSFILANSTPGENEGFLMTFDENGEINHACVVGELKFTVSSSEFVEARRAREAKHAEYERLAEEAVLKRRLMEQEADKRYYKDSMTKKAVSIAAYEAAGILK